MQYQVAGYTKFIDEKRMKRDEEGKKGKKGQKDVLFPFAPFFLLNPFAPFYSSFFA
jgi:hypothetical protein